MPEKPKNPQKIPKFLFDNILKEVFNEVPPTLLPCVGMEISDTAENG
jgi:hypothetical protein